MYPIVFAAPRRVHGGRRRWVAMAAGRPRSRVARSVNTTDECSIDADPTTVVSRVATRAYYGGGDFGALCRVDGTLLMPRPAPTDRPCVAPNTSFSLYRAAPARGSTVSHWRRWTGSVQSASRLSANTSVYYNQPSWRWRQQRRRGDSTTAEPWDAHEFIDYDQCNDDEVGQSARTFCLVQWEFVDRRYAFQCYPSRTRGPPARSSSVTLSPERLNGCCHQPTNIL